METLNFLQKVLPADGVYVSLVINSSIRKQEFHDSIEDLAAHLVACSDAGDNIYYAVASFLDNSSRKQENVSHLKAFFFDVDCGVNKPFPSAREGLIALGQFVAKSGLPKPTIVSSGNGLHAYWVLDGAIPLSEWEPRARALKTLVPSEGGKPLFDPAVPADAARVLRAPGTINPKGGKLVKVLLDSPEVTLAQIDAALPKVAPVVSTSKKSSVAEAILGSSDYPPAHAHIVQAKCAQIKWGTENQSEVSEPFWYSLLGVAAYCHEPEKIALEWSKDHPDFDQHATLRKLAHWKTATTGPATCKRFEAERSEGCKKCPFAGKIASPAQLGVQFQEVAIKDTAPDVIAKVVPIPKPFKRTVRGIVRTVDETDIEVCPFDLYPVSYGKDEILGYEVVRYKWDRPHAGWKELTLRQAFLVDGSREFGSSVADQGIVLKNKKQTEDFQFMLRSYMDELRHRKSMTNLYASMGWKDNFTQFVIGNTLHKRTSDGLVHTEKITLSGTTTNTNSEMYGQGGTLEESVKLTAILEAAKLYVHQFAIGLSLSAPLYELDDTPGITVNLYGPTGAGKTLAQLYQQSMWGNPKKLHFNAKFTQNALYTKLSYYNNLPVTIDEATVISPKDIGELLYTISQGRDKARLNRNAEEKEAKTWSTVVTTSSNKSFASLLLASKMESDAQHARLLDIAMDVHPLLAKNPRVGEQIHGLLMANYGWIGPALLEHWLELGVDVVRHMMKEHKKTFIKKYDVLFAGHERFWENNVVKADFALQQAQELGLIQFDYKNATRHILAQIGVLREVIRENAGDEFDTLSEYLNEHMGHTLTVIHTGKNKGVLDLNAQSPRDNVCVRFDVYRKDVGSPFDRGTLTIDRVHFKKWLAMKGMDYKTLVRAYEINNAVMKHPTNKCYMGKDTPYRLGQTNIVLLTLLHPRLKGILSATDDAVDAQTMTQLAVIK